MVHSTIGRYETPSLHTAIDVKWEARIVTALGWVYEVIQMYIQTVLQMVQNYPLKA